ncbi:hypothetical protein BRADI_3g09537v3 [Brachypodium distachyon]|uniref:Uncharacterized protein n=1 Tax=Brachypodium distachyon TaxID=15368 RepID=A0A2K2CW70_BRADI|nr:hypothetical protein BRADI_3g09537v3 [Brachypodium distachyon]
MRQRPRLLHCPSVRPAWDLLQPLHPNPAACESITELWDQQRNDKVRSTVLIAILWNLWKRRNALVFRGDHEGLHLAIQRSANDLRLWTSRCSATSPRNLLMDWAVMLSHLAMGL